MLALIASRLGQAVFVLAAVSVIAFGLLTLAGDPVANILGPQSTPQDRAALRERMHLDDPFIERYARYVGGLLTGELGVSYATGQPVARVLAERIPATLELAVVAVVLSLALGIPLGVYAAIRREGLLARTLMALSLLGLSLPTFVVAVLLVTVFAVMLGWLPSFGRGQTVAWGWWSTGLLTASGRAALILPALSLAVAQATLVARLVQAEMLEVLRTDFIRFARARGLGERVVTLRHALRNTLVPVITISGLQFGFLLAFSVVVEFVFQWPGLGLLFLQSLEKTDVPVMTAYLVLAAGFFVTVNLVVDLLYLAADPRLRTPREGARGASAA
jgi:peptide/nickel transport system permease protein